MKHTIISIAAASCVSVLAFAVAPLSAEEIVTYDFTDGLKPSAWNPTLLSEQPGEPVFEAGFAGGQGGLSSTRGNLYARIQSTGNTQSAASKFIFTFTPSRALNLGQVTFDIGYQNTGNGPHPAYTLNYQVGVKVGDATEVLLPEVATLDVLSDDDPQYPGGSIAVDTPVTVDLRQFDEINAPITITIYVFTTKTGGSLAPHQTARLDTIAIRTAQ